jgi:5'-nucleotidase / UDP-sugar diphosphatase
MMCSVDSLRPPRIPVSCTTASFRASTWWRGGRRRLYALLLFGLLFAPLHLDAQDQSAAPVRPDVPRLPLTLLHYNDFHAQNLPVDTKIRDAQGVERTVPMGGAAALAGYADSLRFAQINVLLLHAGDDLTGTPVSTLTEGRSQFELLEIIQPDAMTLGNHEFDYGTDNLRRLLRQVSFPVVSANLWDKALGAPFVPRWRLVHLRGLTVGIIGVTTPELPALTMRENVRDLDVLDPVLCVRQAIATLRDTLGADVIVVLSHQGVEADSALAVAVPGIDVIVGGHSHTELDAPLRVGQTLIAQAGSRGRWLGRVDLAIDPRTHRPLSATGSLVELRADLIRPHRVVAARVTELESTVDQRLREVIGTLASPWTRAQGRRESNVGSWMADAVRLRSGADIAFLNSGGIRRDCAAGPITLRDMWEISPFGNDLVSFEVRGAQLPSMLAWQAVSAAEFCQVSGLRYRYDAATTRLDITVDGQPLDSTRTYRIATNHFVGGHLHDVFGLSEASITASPLQPALTDRDALIEAVRAQRRITAVMDGRIEIVNAP